MRVRAILHNWLRDARAWCHLVRYRAVLFAVEALLDGGVLTVTGLGRAGNGRTIAAKHRIKRIDRLVGNPHLHMEVDAFSSLLANKLIGETRQPLLLVDWTPLWGPFHALTAAIPCDGRALLVYWEVHRESVVGRASVQSRFLKNLGKLIPGRCKPIVVTDAGFHAPWFKVVLGLGWDYIGRVRAQVKCTRDGHSWVEVRSYHSRAKTTARDLGVFTVSKSNRIDHRLILVRQRQKPGPKKREIAHKQRPGPKKKGARTEGLGLTDQANRHRVAAKEPWVLATSLDSSPTTILGHYKRRMQTEETYRHLKSSRFGWEFEHGKTKTPARLRALLLIAALAAALLMAVGILAEARNLHLRYQANTTKTRRVLSLLVLAGLVVRDGALIPTPGSLRDAFSTIAEAAGGATP